jgi:anthranilate synthase component 1
MAAAADRVGAVELRVEPSLDEVRELAREHNLVALRHSFIDDLETPVSAFLKLRGRDPQFPAFLLESAEQGQRVGRFSFIGVRPRKVVRWSLGRSAPSTRRRSPTRRRSRAARSASSATTSCARSSRSATPTPTPSGCRTWR